MHECSYLQIWNDMYLIKIQRIILDKNPTKIIDQNLRHKLLPMQNHFPCKMNFRQNNQTNQTDSKTQ